MRVRAITDSGVSATRRPISSSRTHHFSAPGVWIDVGNFYIDGFTDHIGVPSKLIRGCFQYDRKLHDALTRCTLLPEYTWVVPSIQQLHAHRLLINALLQNNRRCFFSSSGTHQPYRRRAFPGRAEDRKAVADIEMTSAISFIVFSGSSGGFMGSQRQNDLNIGPPHTSLRMIALYFQRRVVRPLQISRMRSEPLCTRQVQEARQLGVSRYADDIVGEFSRMAEVVKRIRSIRQSPQLQNCSRSRQTNRWCRRSSHHARHSHSDRRVDYARPQAGRSQTEYRPDGRLTSYHGCKAPLTGAILCNFH